MVIHISSYMSNTFPLSCPGSCKYEYVNDHVWAENLLVGRGPCVKFSPDLHNPMIANMELHDAKCLACFCLCHCPHVHICPIRTFCNPIHCGTIILYRIDLHRCSSSQFVDLPEAGEI